MKTLSLLLVFCFFLCVSGNAQNIQKDAEQLEKILSTFRKKNNEKTRILTDASTGQSDTLPTAITTTSFDTLFKPIYGKVMLGNSNLVSQGSAYALTVDQFESKLNINYNWKAKKKKSDGLFYNAGFAASSSSKVAPVFSKDEWKHGLSLTFGITKGFNQHLHVDVTKEFDVGRQRAIFLAMKETLQTFTRDTTKFKKEQKTLDDIPKSIWDSHVEIKKKLAQLEFEGNKAFEDEKKAIDKSLALHALDSAGMERYVDSVFTDFQTKYFKKFNYSLWWYNASIRPEYRAITIYDSSAANITGIKKKDFLAVNLDVSINYASSKKNSLVLMQVALNLKNTNYLEGKKAADLQQILQPILANFDEVKNDKAIVVEDAKKYKRKFLLATPSVLINYFIGEKRLFGWECLFSGKFGFEPSDISFDNLYSLRTGPLLSFNGKSDLAKSTFGLLVEWKDVPGKKNTVPKDYFSFSIRIGIPFNI